MSYNIKKDPRLAFVFSVLFPGLGHIYCGELRKGILIPITIILTFVSVGLSSNFFPDSVTLFIFIIIPSIVAWSIYDAKKLAERKNEILSKEKKEEEKLQELKITSSEFASKIDKIFNLYQNDIFTSEEFKEEKKSIIENLDDEIVTEEPESFLTSLIPLKKQGGLTERDIKLISSKLEE